MQKNLILYAKLDPTGTSVVAEETRELLDVRDIRKAKNGKPILLPMTVVEPQLEDQVIVGHGYVIHDDRVEKTFTIQDIPQEEIVGDRLSKMRDAFIKALLLSDKTLEEIRVEFRGKLDEATKPKGARANG